MQFSKKHKNMCVSWFLRHHSTVRLRKRPNWIFGLSSKLQERKAERPKTTWIVFKERIELSGVFLTLIAQAVFQTIFTWLSRLPANHGKPKTCLGNKAGDSCQLARQTTKYCVNDPSAGSPTETLLRLLLPLSDKVHETFRRNVQKLSTASVRIIHRITQSVGATGGVYKGQGRNRHELLTRAY